MSAAKRPAETSAPIHDHISHRWSPRAFEDRPVEPEKLRSLFEAARWAASSYNGQPWSFLVGTKDDMKSYNLILDSLVEFNQGWAKAAPVLVLTVAKQKFDHNGEPNKHAWHDVGQSAANLAIQAEALGLQAHQMAGILPDKARANFGIPEGYDVVAAIAIGYPGDASSLPEAIRKGEAAPRQRKPLESFVFSGKWGHPAPVAAPKA